MFGGDWTAQRVIDRLTLVFASLPGTGIYSPRAGVLESWTGPIDGLDLLTATAECLGPETPRRVALLTLCRAAPGRGVAAACQELGIHRRTLYRRARRAAEEVATCLNSRHRALVFARMPRVLWACA